MSKAIFRKRLRVIFIFSLILLLAGCSFNIGSTFKQKMKNYQTLYIGDNKTLISLYENDKLSLVQTAKPEDYAKYKIIIVEEKSKAALDIEAAKEAVLSGTNIFMIGFEKSGYATEKFLGAKATEIVKNMPKDSSLLVHLCKDDQNGKISMRNIVYKHDGSEEGRYKGLLDMIVVNLR